MPERAERTPGDVRFADIGGHRIEYRWIGLQQIDHPVLVFLHEGLGCAGLWRDIPDVIAAATGCSALVYSRPGYGNSGPADLPRPARFMHDEALDMLPAVLDHFSIRHAILIGHSDGGSIALIHAGSDLAGDRIRGVVTLAAHVFNEEACRRGIEAARKAYEETDLRDRLARYHGDNVDIAFRGWNDVWLSDGFRDWNIEDILPDIHVPLLVIQG
ncbi:MAG: alpha/beta fold hydrolase, partial [Rhodospirillales bacterium]